MVFRSLINGHTVIWISKVIVEKTIRGFFHEKVTVRIKDAIGSTLVSVNCIG